MSDNRSLPFFTTVSWGSRKNERWSSKIHYDSGNGYTLCGKRIPQTQPSGDSWDMCEKCAKLLKSERKSQ